MLKMKRVKEMRWTIRSHNVENEKEERKEVNNKEAECWRWKVKRKEMNCKEMQREDEKEERKEMKHKDVEWWEERKKTVEQ